MAKWKKRTIIIGLVILAVALPILAVKFTWRIIPGYNLCDEPNWRTRVIRVEENQVTFDITIANLGLFYDGYKCKVKDNTMYIGVKTIFLLGRYPADSVEFTVPTEERVEKIVLCGRGKEKVIYQQEEDE